MFYICSIYVLYMFYICFIYVLYMFYVCSPIRYIAGSSMLSPRSDSETEHSIAVDCHTNPSEVIVKGKNVKQVCEEGYQHLHPV